MDIRSLVTRLGGAAHVARMCGITSQAVSQWHQVPVHQCSRIERATNGAVSRYELRPDIFGAEPIDRQREAA